MATDQLVDTLFCCGNCVFQAFTDKIDLKRFQNLKVDGLNHRFKQKPKSGWMTKNSQKSDWTAPGAKECTMYQQPRQMVLLIRFPGLKPTQVGM